MNDLISREEFINDIENRYCKPCEAEGKDYNHSKCQACWVDDMMSEIETSPAVDAVEVVHGQWIEKTGYAVCSVCLDECWADSVLEYNFCPNCGAKMDGG